MTDSTSYETKQDGADDSRATELDAAPGGYATYCPDCGAFFFDDQEGFDQDECFECGEPNCYEVPA